MSVRDVRDAAWTERAANRSPSVQKSRLRSVEQARQLVDAANRLLAENGQGFTTQELAKEAGVALQTFYRYFASKDELILAVIEESIIDGCEQMEKRGAKLEKPLDRLRLYITGAIEALSGEYRGASGFITAEHYRLYQLFPNELASAAERFADLLMPEIAAAAAAGDLAPGDIEAGAWFVTQLSTSTFHHYSYVTPTEPLDGVADQLWDFCFRALGGKS